MEHFRLLIVAFLATQLLLGQVGFVLAQTGRGGDKGKQGGSRLFEGGAKSKGSRAATQGGGQREGVIEALAPALERLPGGRVLSQAVVPDEYVLGPGDGLSVNIWGEFEEIYEVRVSPEGKISLPTMGDLKVKGLSLTQAHALIDAEVKHYYRNVKSGLSLMQLRVFEVPILGAVNLPGTYLATPVKRISDLVAEAGGVLAGGSWRQVQIRRDGQVVATADITAYLRRGDTSANPFVKDGDTIFVPPLSEPLVLVITNEVVVAPQSGQVTETSTPANVEMKPGERITHLFSEIGGVSPWWNLESIYIIRETKVPEGTMKVPVDGRRLIFDNDESQNIELLHGDQVFIPSNVRRVFVNGVVLKGGAFPYVPNRTAEEYLGIAGGVSLQASLDRSTIRHADGTVEPFRPELILANGDTIQVEQKYFATPADYIGIIGGITSLVFSGFAFLSTLK